jgi:hypothetical protein
MKRPLEGTREAAEIVAIQALTFIAEEPERLARFLEATGIDAAQIRAAAASQAFSPACSSICLGMRVS